jgi:hypothetical protein
MTRRFYPFLLAVLCLVASVSAGAASHPAVTGIIQGYEFCPQSLCDAAFFGGNFSGTIGNKAASGLFFVGVNHDPLPDPNQSAAITGGSWSITTDVKSLRGAVTGGTIYNNGDGTFLVTVILEISKGGNGTMTFTGTLNHNVFPPTIAGGITQ